MAKKPMLLSDLFHEQVPDEYVLAIWAVMEAAPQHVYQILTKRPERMRDFLRGAGFADDSERIREAERVRKGYGDRLLIDDLSFSLPPAGIVGVMSGSRGGPNTPGPASCMAPKPIRPIGLSPRNDVWFIPSMLGTARSHGSGQLPDVDGARPRRRPIARDVFEPVQVEMLAGGGDADPVENFR